MSSSQFHERFKDKSSTIKVNGEFEVDPSRAVLKPSILQMHSSVIQNSGNYIVKAGILIPDKIKPLHRSKFSLNYPMSELDKPHIQSSVLPVTSLSPKMRSNNTNQSANPIMKKQVLCSSSDICDLNRSEERKSFDFVPYTIKDYYSIKPKTYYQLGGLGPSSVGSNEWSKKKEMNEKRIKYGRKVYFVNAANLPLIPIGRPDRDQVEIENSREKGINFAKKIRKPPLKKTVIES